MLLETRARVESALEETEQANTRLQKLETQTRKDIEDLAKAYAGHKSSVLAGIIGGVAGAAGGITIATGAATIAVTGPLGAAIGVALAVLAWRGPAHWRVERATERVREALDLHYRELNRLPKDVPQYIRDNLWERYDKLMSSYAAVVERAVGDGEPPARQSTTRDRTIEGEVIVEK